MGILAAEIVILHEKRGKHEKEHNYEMRQLRPYRGNCKRSGMHTVRGLLHRTHGGAGSKNG